MDKKDVCRQILEKLIVVFCFIDSLIMENLAKRNRYGYQMLLVQKAKIILDELAGIGKCDNGINNEVKSEIDNWISESRGFLARTDSKEAGQILLQDSARIVRKIISKL